MKADHCTADHEEVVVGWPDWAALCEGDGAPAGDVGEPAHLGVVLGQRARTQVRVLYAVFSSKESLLEKKIIQK